MVPGELSNPYVFLSRQDEATDKMDGSFPVKGHKNSKYRNDNQVFIQI